MEGRFESVREVSQTGHRFGGGTAARRDAARRQGAAMFPTVYGCGFTSRARPRFQSGRPAAQAVSGHTVGCKTPPARNPAEDGRLAPAWRRTAPCSDEMRGPGFELARARGRAPKAHVLPATSGWTPAEGADPKGPERHPEMDKARGKAAKTTELLRATREPSLFSAPERAAGTLELRTARFALATVRR